MGRKAGEPGEESTQQAAAAAVGGRLQGGAPASEGRLSVRRLSFQWGQSSREGLQPARGGSR